MAKPPATQRAPQSPMPHEHVGGILSTFVANIDALAQRLGVTLASIFGMTILALLSIYWMKENTAAIVVIYLIGIVATIFAQWKRL